MKVQVLGAGCAKCKQLTANVQEAALLASDVLALLQAQAEA